MKQLRIETDRLVIRAYQENDLLEAFELMQEKELYTFLPMDVMSLNDYKNLFSWLMKCYDISPKNDWFKYSFVITKKDDGRQIGWCGVGSLDFNHADKEVFYLIGKPFWGNGYASEAVQSLIEFCFNKLDLSELVAVVKPENNRSVSVIEKLGFEYQYDISGLPEEYDFYNGEFYYRLSKKG